MYLIIVIVKIGFQIISSLYCVIENKNLNKKFYKTKEGKKKKNLNSSIDVINC